MMPPRRLQKNCDQLICGFLHRSGVWVEENQRLLRLWQIVATSCFLCTNVAQSIALFLARHDTDKVFECASVLTFCGMGMLKQISLSRNSKHWQTILKLMTKLETEQFEERNFNNELEYDSDGNQDIGNNISDFVFQYTNNFKFIKVYLSRLYIATLIVFVLSPFIEFGIRILSTEAFSIYPHILPIWSPLDNITFFGYLLTIVCEVIAATFCVAVHISFDLTSVGIMIFTCGQFELLKFYSERIGGRGKSYFLSEKRDARAMYRIKTCHYMHGILNKIIKDLGNLTRSILGVYFAIATLTLCSVAVQLNTVSLSVTQLISLFQYMFATLLQLYLYCRYGNSVFHGSSVGMGEGPNVSALWCLSPRVRKHIMMLNIGIMKPKRLMAGPFYTLDMPSFIQILRASYSYYAVLGHNSEQI